MINIHSVKMAGWLMYRGHKLIKIYTNVNNPKFNVFVFDDNEGVRRDMSEYTRYRGR